MEFLGYFSAIAIGVLLGVIGGGGSILTIPLLVYVFGIDPILATTYSLFIVGTSSWLGGIPKYTQGLVDLKTAFLFGIPSILSVTITRAFIAPSIPERILKIGSFELNKSVFLMILFASLMIAASISMIKDKKFHKNAIGAHEPSNKISRIIFEGLVIGLLTGLVGAGGGFLIIPALVIFGRLSMKVAVGTSLIIIAANSTIGFLSGLTHVIAQIDWIFLRNLSLFAVAGIFLGHRMSKKWDGNKLKKNFGRIIFVLGISILLFETIKIIQFR